MVIRNFIATYCLRALLTMAAGRPGHNRLICHIGLSGHPIRYRAEKVMGPETYKSKQRFGQTITTWELTEFRLVLPTRNKRAKNTRALGLEHLSSALADGLNRPEQGLPLFYLSRDSTISSMQSNKPSTKAPNIAAQAVTAAPETNTAAEVTAEPLG